MLKAKVIASEKSRKRTLGDTKFGSHHMSDLINLFIQFIGILCKFSQFIVYLNIYKKSGGYMVNVLKVLGAYVQFLSNRSSSGVKVVFSFS